MVANADGSWYNIIKCTTDVQEKGVAVWVYI